MTTRPAGDDALAANPFDWQVTRDGKVLVSRGGRQVSVVAGARGAKLAVQLEGCDEATAQQLLARATGSYKQGTKPTGRG